MKITVVGAALLVAAAIIAVIVVRALTNPDVRVPPPDGRGNG